ncbi:hypothetical protein X777_01111 [Ooceraea biroi]|uniref:Uncharacterized protein n=1 Tax=Ooceraea biroi TaxID=2015173 RepID=A0A026WR29_OOCBI|nr:hypothetical protein X777_01111 [Ooceraea biroi]
MPIILLDSKLYYLRITPVESIFVRGYWYKKKNPDFCKQYYLQTNLLLLARVYSIYIIHIFGIIEILTDILLTVTNIDLV